MQKLNPGTTHWFAGDAAPGSQDDSDGIDAESLEDMISNGVSKADARAALKHTDNDLIAAYDFHMSSGTAGDACALQRLERQERRQRQRDGGTVSSTNAAVQDSDRESQEQQKQATLRQEVTQVVKAFMSQMAKAQSGGRNLVIKRLERVQNWRLWTKYRLRQRWGEGCVSL